MPARQRRLCIPRFLCRLYDFPLGVFTSVMEQWERERKQCNFRRGSRWQVQRADGISSSATPAKWFLGCPLRQWHAVGWRWPLHIWEQSIIEYPVKT
mmetsp:Transcript_18560/g.51769  ORF Transcript_18560/g.51769 Transcript_18560/m.51769 type:complete len:97 (-) Transcript_18560:941-1231(-)